MWRDHAKVLTRLFLSSMDRYQTSEAVCRYWDLNYCSNQDFSRISRDFFGYWQLSVSIVINLLLSARRRNQTWILLFVHIFLVVGTYRVYPLETGNSTDKLSTLLVAAEDSEAEDDFTCNLVFNQVRFCVQPPHLIEVEPYWFSRRSQKSWCNSWTSLFCSVNYRAVHNSDLSRSPKPDYQSGAPGY